YNQLPSVGLGGAGPALYLRRRQPETHHMRANVNAFGRDLGGQSTWVALAGFQSVGHEHDVCRLGGRRYLRACLAQALCERRHAAWIQTAQTLRRLASIVATHGCQYLDVAAVAASVVPVRQNGQRDV